MEQQTMLSLAELAARWGIGYSTLRQAIKDGRVHAVRLGPACVRVPLAEVLRIESARQAPGAGSAA